jgi:hypothetical protein
MPEMKKPQLHLLTIIFASVLFSASLQAQDKSPVRSSILLQYVSINEERTLQATLTYSGATGDVPLKGAEIVFRGIDKTNPLGTVSTDENGIARYTFGANAKLFDEKSGSGQFSSEFKGKDTIDASSAEISIKEVTLEMTLSLVDTVKTINIAAYTLDNGVKVPVKAEVVNVFVPRMFSNLPVADVTLDEKGTARLEFPSDIPGDKEGNLPIVARFTENPVFGTVGRSITEKWGVPNTYSFPAAHRALWTKTPPRWMIITLSVLLTGVWGHYMFAVISLILIRIDAKRKKAKDEYKL